MLGPILALAHINERIHEVRRLLNPARLDRIAAILRGSPASILERNRLAATVERIAEEVRGEDENISS